MQLFTPETAELLPKCWRENSLFLAGSIENGIAEKWQNKVIQSLSDRDLDIFNPRRENWNSEIKQDISCEEFVDQVDWEQFYIMISKNVLFYFAPDTKAPITLLEFGQVLGYNHMKDFHQNIFVCCPPGYWRRGNVEFLAKYSLAGSPKLKWSESLDELISQLKEVFK